MMEWIKALDAHLAENGIEVCDRRVYEDHIRYDVKMDDVEFRFRQYDAPGLDAEQVVNAFYVTFTGHALHSNPKDGKPSTPEMWKDLEDD